MGLRSDFLASSGRLVVVRTQRLSVLIMAIHIHGRTSDATSAELGLAAADDDDFFRESSARA
jgi:hypothetical protein|eukprot:COSAG01_NODE_7572_length_3143_cov_6.958607_4_plen_62_part_00